VIYIYAMFFILIFFGGLFWYVEKRVFNECLQAFQNVYPSLFSGNVTTFMQRIWFWMPLFIVFLGLLWVYVQSQRRREPEGYVIE